MAVAVIMPKQGSQHDPDDVAPGDVLFEYETDKAAFEETSNEAGKILALLHEEGDDVPCLENVCVIGQEGEDISAFLNFLDLSLLYSFLILKEFLLIFY